MRRRRAAAPGALALLLLLPAGAARAQSIADLCAPCSDGAQCQSGICAIDAAASYGICTQACANPGNPCPLGFTCSPTPQNVSICSAAQSDSCPAPKDYIAPLHVTCANPGTADNPNSAIVQRPCAAGLTCFGFASGVGYCLTACNATDPTATCPAGQQCCYDLDAQGHCVGSAPTTPNGGCFFVRHSGNSCVDEYQSVCDPQTECYFVANQTQARCYHFCDTGSCAAGEICVTGAFPDGQGGTASVCCDQHIWDANNLSTCLPVNAPCLRQSGVLCDNDAQCLSGTCLRNHGTAACSAPCTSDGDCPSAAADVNGDGRPDGGGHCIAVGSSGRCWPLTVPAAAPACAASAVPAPSAGSHGGCAALPPAAPLAVLALAARRLRCAGRRGRRRSGT